MKKSAEAVEPEKPKEGSAEVTVKISNPQREKEKSQN